MKPQKEKHFAKSRIISDSKTISGKKLAALLLGASITGVCLVGCSGKNNASDTEPSETTGASQTTEASAETAQNTDAAQEKNTENPDSSAISANKLYPLPDSAQDAGIYVEPIPGISDEFIRGMDVSSVLVEENSGVKYYGFDGKEQDVFKTFAEAGVNYARIRVWNDPYDENGNGYGGGNNDVDTAIALGKRATENGMKVCIDFHYSDFWADPKKQIVPKAWADMTLEEKSSALYDFTKESLKKMLDAGLDIGIVQVGNETNNGMSGESLIPNVAQLMNAGSRAIREVSEEYGKDIRVALHYTDAHDASKIESIIYKLSTFQVDYDIFALSYYPYWHGTAENIRNLMTNIREKYGKDVMIAETSYCYTTEDSDGCGNSVDASDLLPEYGATVQSQSAALRDVCDTANSAGALGVFYWEGAWITVNSEGGATADNSAIWEKYGSGWASSYSADYDPEDAGKYYGGCSWDNQALFAPDGTPLESINTYKWLKYGTNAAPAVDMVNSPSVTINLNTKIELPEKVDVVYNNRSLNTSLTAVWDEAQINGIDTSKPGEHVISGTVTDETGSSYDVSCTVKVEMMNYVKNPGFEDADTSMWDVVYEGDKNPTDFQEKGPDAHTGTYSFHFWDEKDMDFTITQSFTDLEPGTYELKAYFQGGDINDDADMYLFTADSSGSQTDSAGFKADGYANWQEPSISNIKVTDGTLTIGIHISCNAKGWGTMDDFTLNKID